MRRLQNLRGILVGLLLLINLCGLPLAAILVAGFRLLLPVPSWRRAVNHFLHEVMPPIWQGINNAILNGLLPTRWEIRGPDSLNRCGWYFLICNHQSWLDILVLGRVFNKRVAMLKFFMKRELLWMLPIGGLACYVMGFPLMYRYSKSYLKKHPEKIGKDLEVTKKACEKFRHQPVTIINFLEGTRATPEKIKNTLSPYRHLLSPRAGGLSFVIDAMEDQIKEIIDVTIIYPDKSLSFWDFLCGRVEHIVVDYQLIPVTDDLIGDYYQDKAFRRAFQSWLNQLWQRKDDKIEQYYQQR